MASPPVKKSLAPLFFGAAKTGNLNMLKQLGRALDDGKGLARTIADVKDPSDRGVLHAAAAHGKINVCKYVLEELKLNVDMKDDKGETPLFQAAIGGHLSTAVYLLENGADPATVNNSSHTPLHYAAGQGHRELLCVLLSKGVDVNALSDTGTPLLLAAGCGRQDAVKILLDYHADPNFVVSHLHTPLAICIFAKSLQCTKLLIQAGADPNGKSCGATPLGVAAFKGETEIIKFLLKSGADPNITNNTEQKPIEIAALHGNHRDVRTLFPVTSPIPTHSDWSVAGIIRHVHSEEAIQQLKLKVKKKFLEAKSKGEDAFRRKEYSVAVRWYTEAIGADPTDAIVLSNRSLCWARMKDGDFALSDAEACIMLRPDWPKAYYRAGVAWNLLKKFDAAADAFFEGLKLDPENKELRNAFQEAVEARMNSIGVQQER